MTMSDVFDKLRLCGIVPVLTVEEVRDAKPLAEALVAGGLPCAEVTFRTGAARDAIDAMVKSVPGMLVGAGNVQSVQQVREATDAGAQFIVSPGLSRPVVEYCLDKKIPVIPGVVTPTEIEAAMSYGLDVLKFFPAEAAGGVPFLRSISAPYRKVRFIPTGGIDEINLLSYLNLPSVLACGGSWMVNRDLVAGGKFGEIKALTAAAVKTMLGLRLRHVGIHAPSAGEAPGIAALLAKVLRVDVNDTPGSLFIGTDFEILRTKGLGAHGHVALGTNFIDRAIEYFSRLGIGIKPETHSEKNGKLSTVYLDLDVAGFAVHLVQL